MPSSATPRNRLELQAAGENLNTWGAPKLNNDISQIDASLDGWISLTVTGTVMLTSVNYLTDQARNRFLDVTAGTGGTIVIPAVQKWYLVRNVCSGNVIITTGSGDVVTLNPGDFVALACNGTDVRQLGADYLGFKDYVNQVAWSYNAGNLPAQAGNAGKFVKTDGTNASWQTVETTDIGDWTTQRQDIINLAVAFAVAL